MHAYVHVQSQMKYSPQPNFKTSRAACVADLVAAAQPAHVDLTEEQLLVEQAQVVQCDIFMNTCTHCKIISGMTCCRQSQACHQAYGLVQPPCVQWPSRINGDLQAVLAEWSWLADCNLVASGGIRFHVCKICVARLSRVLMCALAQPRSRCMHACSPVADVLQYHT